MHPEVEAWIKSLQDSGHPINVNAHINEFGVQVSELYAEEALVYFDKEYPDTQEGTFHEWTHMEVANGEVYWLFRYCKPAIEKK